MTSTLGVRYEFELDTGARLIRVTSSGTWTPGDVDAYSRHFREHVTAARERFGDIRVLVDGRNAETHDAEVGRRLAQLATFLDGSKDRFAVVTPSSLRKQQAARGGLPGDGMAFVSIDAAEMWLLAHD